MNFRPTPPLFLSIGLPSYGIYLLISTPADYDFLDEQLLGIILLVIGIFCFVVYCIFRFTFFPSKLRKQVLAESLLIAISLFALYKLNGRYQFTLPQGYQGYVIIVYGIENAPSLKRPFYSNKAYVKVPSTGAIVTSSLPDRKYDHTAIFLDSALGNIEDLPEETLRFGFNYKSNTLACRSGNHPIEIWVVTNEAEWTTEKDSIYQLERKLNDMCELLDR